MDAACVDRRAGAGFFVVKVFKAEREIIRLFSESNRALEHEKFLRRRLKLLVGMIGSVTGIFAQLGVFLAGAWMARGGYGLTAGAVILFVNLMNFLIEPVAELPSLLAERGEEYLCGENGSGLSGGEKQRISIARSLLKQSSVLLADEATAALDAETAHRVSAELLDLSEMTRIVVTHSLEEALLRRCDGILVLKDGRLAEMGRFDELMENKGYFYALYTVSQ